MSSTGPTFRLRSPVWAGMLGRVALSALLLITQGFWSGAANAGAESPAPDKAEWVVLPGSAVGSIAIGAMAREVCERFAPCRKSSEKSYDLPDQAVSLLADSNGMITAIFLYRPSGGLGARQPKIALAGRLTWGSREEDLELALEAPDARQSNRDGTRLVYSKIGLSVTFDPSGELHQLTVQRRGPFSWAAPTPQPVDLAAPTRPPA